jgi:hypothetical protein
MQTSFSLIYFEGPKTVSDLTSIITGPELFSSRSAAIDKLFLHIENPLIKGLEDVLQEYIEGHDLLSNDTDPMTNLAYIKANDEEKLIFVEYYFNYMQDDLWHAGFSIEELPTSSFFEQLERANAIEIDGQFIRYFSLTSVDDLAGNDMEAELHEQLIFESEIWDDDMNKHVFEFTYGDVMNAYYCSNRKAWRVKNHDVTLIKFST